MPHLSPCCCVDTDEHDTKVCYAQWQDEGFVGDSTLYDVVIRTDQVTTSKLPDERFKIVLGLRNMLAFVESIGNIPGVTVTSVRVKLFKRAVSKEHALDYLRY